MKQERTDRMALKARQGPQRRSFFNVLLMSAALAVLGFAFLSWILTADLEPSNDGVSATVESERTVESDRSTDG